ncbi:proline-, glutamic acid- and leucine-rich protein 1-like [Periplaneta americana]|uniref:proline-, glutamic acid- and leucine-rich protein 1-like n=1 Tax=Periplaneta americana TaxID=6978 RepID=UPI0037E7B35D
MTMDEMLSLFETIVHSNCHNSLLYNFLKTCTEQQAFLNKAPNAIQPIVAYINNKLNTSTTRHEGLLLLKTFLPQCSVDLFGEYVVSWMEQCLKIREDDQNKKVFTNTSYQVLKILLQMSDSMPELKRPVSGLVVPKVIDNFQQILPKEAPLSVLECLEILMSNYGPSCGQQKNILEKCLLQYIDTVDVNISKRTARCVAFLPLLGGGGSLGANHVARWKQDLQKICATLHCILDDLFDNIRELPNSYRNTTESETLPLPAITETTPLVRVYQLATRFVNVSRCLQAMLVCEFPVEKTVLPDVILGLVCRGLGVNSHTLGKKVSTDLLMVGAMLPQIHVSLLNIVDALITCCGRNLLPFASVICKLVLQTLKWTSTEKWMYGIEKPYGQLRVAAYNTLTLWLQTSNCSSCVELLSEQLVSIIVQDIRFEKELVTLSVKNSKSNTGKKQHKNKQALPDEQGIDKSKRHIPDQKANSKTCKAALKALQWILHAAASFIKPDIHRLLQEITVGQLCDIQRTSKPQDLPLPYCDAACRLELYQLLYTLTLEPHTTWPPPTQFALCMLSRGRSDLNMKVSGFCTSALTAVEKIVHPAGGTLQFPVSVDEMMELTRNYSQQYATANEVGEFSIDSPEEVTEESSQETEPKQCESNTVASNSKPVASSSDEVEILYENEVKMYDECENDEFSENEVMTVDEDSEEVDNRPLSSLGIREFPNEVIEDGEENAEEEVPVVDIADSDLEVEEQNETETTSLLDDKNDRNEICETPVPQVEDSENDRNEICETPVPQVEDSENIVEDKTEPPISRKSDHEVATTSENAQETIVMSDSTKNNESASDGNKCLSENEVIQTEKDENISQDMQARNKETEAVTSNVDKAIFLETDNSESEDIVLRYDSDDEKDDDGPSAKKMKLDLEESLKNSDTIITNTLKTDSLKQVKDNLERQINEEKQPVNGVGDATEEEMLKSFVDAITE